VNGRRSEEQWLIVLLFSNCDPILIAAFSLTFSLFIVQSTRSEPLKTDANFLKRNVFSWQQTPSFGSRNSCKKVNERCYKDNISFIIKSLLKFPFLAPLFQLCSHLVHFRSHLVHFRFCFLCLL